MVHVKEKHKMAGKEGVIELTLMTSSAKWLQFLVKTL